MQQLRCGQTSWVKWCVVLLCVAALLLGACTDAERPTLSSTDSSNNTAESTATDTIVFGRQAGEPALGRVAREPGEPLPPVVHVLGSIRSIADETVRFSNDASPVVDDLATIVSQGCTPGECPAGQLGQWAGDQVEIVNVATRAAASEGTGQLGAHVADLRESGLTVIGYGESAESAAAPVIFTTGAQEIAIHAISLDPDNPALATESTAGVSGIAQLDLLRESIIDNRNNGRGVVVLVDWGIQEGRAPTDQQIADVEQIVDAGADAIVGHGSDFLQRFDLVSQSAVAYSLGNASITTADPLRADTAILRLEFDTPGRSCLLPATAGPSGPALDLPEDTTCA